VSKEFPCGLVPTRKILVVYYVKKVVHQEEEMHIVAIYFPLCHKWAHDVTHRDQQPKWTFCFSAGQQAESSLDSRNWNKN
jgi:hypothetical protein